MPKYGDVREDGYIFGGTKSDGRRESWYSPEAWERKKTFTKHYCKVNIARRGSGQVEKDSERGTASELFVESELLRKGFSVGRPSNRFSKHDLFVKVGGVWRTVQIKTGQINNKTGHIGLAGGRSRGITSDLIAAVDLEGHRIRWISNTNKAVPIELLE